MQRLLYGAVSSLVILLTTIPAQAEPSTVVIAQSNDAIAQMFREQRVLTDEIQALMTQMKILMAQMKAVTPLPVGETPTLTDLYRQQQVLSTQMDSLIGRTKLDAIAPTSTPATVQTVHHQQQVMMDEIKTMMVEMKQMMTVFRGRVTGLN